MKQQKSFIKSDTFGHGSFITILDILNSVFLSLVNMINSSKYYSKHFICTNPYWICIKFIIVKWMGYWIMMRMIKLKFPNRSSISCAADTSSFVFSWSILNLIVPSDVRENDFNKSDTNADIPNFRKAKKMQKKCWQ